MFLSLPRSLSSTLESSAIPLFELSLQLLAQVFFFSLTTIPCSSTLCEMSFHFLLDLGLFHWSF